MQGKLSEAEASGGLSWDTPIRPHKYASVVVVGKTVVLVRHYYAETGNVEEIFNEYLDEKAREK